MPIHLIVVSVISVFGIIAGGFMFYLYLTKKLHLPNPDKWYISVLGPTKGKEYIIGFVGIAWVIFFSLLLVVNIEEMLSY